MGKTHLRIAVNPGMLGHIVPAGSAPSPQNRWAASLTVEEITRRSGLGSAANLGMQFRRTYTTTPLAYRSALQQGRVL